MKTGVFISHKSEDAKAAQKLQELLERYAKGKRLVFFRSEEIAKGDDWWEAIRRALAKSHIMLLLFTDPNQNWGWCLWEAGLFSRGKKSRNRRLICLHGSKVSPPMPLKHIQTVRADPTDMERFLRQLLTERRLTRRIHPIAPYLRKTKVELETLTREMCALIDREALDSRYQGVHFRIRVTNPNNLREDAIPPDAVVTAENKGNWRLFDRAHRDGGWSWSELEVEARKNPDVRWIPELARAMFRARKLLADDRIVATFHERRGSRVFRPILWKTDWQADGSVQFHVLFSEEVTWKLEDLPEKLSPLLTTLRSGTRFRYEMTEKYLRGLPELARASEDAPLQEAARDLHRTILDIDAEVGSRGQLDDAGENLFAAFDPDEADNVRKLFADWYPTQEKLLKILEDEENVRGHLDEILECLKVFRRISMAFMPIAAHRYAAHVEREMGSTPG